MARAARILFGLLVALVVLAGLFAPVFILSRITPGTSPIWFFGAAGVLFTILVLSYLHRRSAE